jgi:hypothetical protein
MSRALQKPGASYAMEAPVYISPFVIKTKSYEDEQRKYVDRVMSPGYYDSHQYEACRARDKRQDFEDLHLMWTRQRAKYAKTGDLHDLIRLMDFVTETNPPEKTPDEIEALRPKAVKKSRAERRREKFPEGYWHAWWNAPLGDPRFQISWPFSRRAGRSG